MTLDFFHDCFRLLHGFTIQECISNSTDIPPLVRQHCSTVFCIFCFCLHWRLSGISHLRNCAKYVFGSLLQRKPVQGNNHAMVASNCVQLCSTEWKNHRSITEQHQKDRSLLTWDLPPPLSCSYCSPQQWRPEIQCLVKPIHQRHIPELFHWFGSAGGPLMSFCWSGALQCQIKIDNKYVLL